MIRCRQCNSELTEQALFCNVCGLPQKYQEPALKQFTPNRAETPETNSPNHCEHCGAKISYEAQFCAICGTTQSPKKGAVIGAPFNKPAASDSKTSWNKDLPVRLQPSVVVKPTQYNKTVQEQLTNVSENAYKHPKSKTDAPVFPTRPTSNRMKAWVDTQKMATIDSGPVPESPEDTTHSKQDKQQISQQTAQGIQNYPQATIDPNSIQNRSQQQTVYNRATSDKPLWQASSPYAPDELSSRSTSVKNGNGKNGISDSSTINLLNPASFMATSNAAEQWRKSWRDRQYIEAGPAETVARGQASVPTPLTSMQQSFLRMRAIQKGNKEIQGKRPVNLSTWITIFLMICLIIGLGAYLIISYFPSSPFATQTSTSSTNTAQPRLGLVGTSTQTVTIGRSIQLRGVQFGDNQTIIFLRDTARPIIDSSGKNILTRTDNEGTFVVTIPIDDSWSVGSHSIEALDQSNNQNAFFTIQAIPSGTATTSSMDLSITMQGKPVSRLNFMSVMGQENPEPQQITITNTSGLPLQWTATASTNNNLNWLQINDNNDSGQLAISQPHALFISVNTTGLKTTDKNHAYLGQIIFTINNGQLLTFPVQLQIVDATPEMVFSPNPIVAQIGPGNTCQSTQPNVPLTLTLINLGNAAISWAVNPDLTDKIKFVSNGQLLESGTLLPSGSLLPSGQPGDTIVLTLQCNNIQIGQSYHISVYANQLSWSGSVIITNN